ncbi:MAG: hypothetical protein ACRD38_02500 [Nitrososphaerales archaeon]
MSLITLKIKDEIKKKMRKYRHINWSEVARNAIEERIRLEELAEPRHVDPALLKKAIEVQDRIRAKSSGKWSATEEIRKWRESRK